MQGQQDSQRVLFDTVDLESLIPEDHLLRRIEARIDFNFIYDVTKNLYCTDNGRNSIDPVLFFRMQLISYLYGKEGRSRAVPGGSPEPGVSLVLPPQFAR